MRTSASIHDLCRLNRHYEIYQVLNVHFYFHFARLLFHGAFHVLQVIKVYMRKRCYHKYYKCDRKSMGSQWIYIYPYIRVGSVACVSEISGPHHARQFVDSSFFLSEWRILNLLLYETTSKSRWRSCINISVYSREGIHIYIYICTKHTCTV